MKKLLIWGSLSIFLLSPFAIPAALIGFAIIASNSESIANSYCEPKPVSYDSVKVDIRDKSVKIAGIRLDSEQLGIVEEIIGQGIERKLPIRDIKIAIMVAYQESDGIRNLDYGHLDSFGVFQQRPSQGWGSRWQIMQVPYAVRKFYDALERVGSRSEKSLLEVALAVQKPSLAAYTQVGHAFMDWEQLADGLLVRYADLPASKSSQGMPAYCPEDSNATQAGSALDGSWSQPLQRSIVSGFCGMRIHPIRGDVSLHQGNDYEASLGSPVMAITGGIVEKAGFLGGWSGNAVIIRHYINGQVYRSWSAHLFKVVPDLMPGDTVKAGQVIGYAGSSGLSTGPHLHLQIEETLDGHVLYYRSDLLIKSKGNTLVQCT